MLEIAEREPKGTSVGLCVLPLGFCLGALLAVVPGQGGFCGRGIRRHIGGRVLASETWCLLCGLD